MRYVNKMTISWPYWYNLEQNVPQSTKSYFQQRRVLSHAWSIPASTQEMGSFVLLWDEVTRMGFHPWVGTIPWRRKWQKPTLVFLPGKSHGQTSLAGYSPWGLKESGHDWSHACIKVQAVKENERTSSFSSLKSHWDSDWVKVGWTEEVKAENTDTKAEDHRKTWVNNQTDTTNHSDCGKWNRFQGDEESDGTLQKISQQPKPKIRHPQHSNSIYRKRECSYELFH